MIHDVEQEAALVMRGYTVSADNTATLAGIGDDYVMRDVHGNRLVYAKATTSLERLAALWAVFRAEALSRPRPPTPSRTDEAWRDWDSGAAPAVPLEMAEASNSLAP